MGLIQNKVTVSQPVSHIVVENAGGLRGETGSQGPEGPAGAPGEAATVSVGTTTTLPAGSSATVTNTGTTSDAVFNFGIPKGDKGDKGDAGAGLVITGSVATYADLPNDLGPEDAGKAYFVEADGKLYVWSGTQFPAEGEGSQFEGPQGPAGQDGQDGEDGQAATITVGSTTTLTPGSSATVTNSGTTSAAILDFGIPAGAKGETGETGPAGPANTLSIGTVEKGETAAATITGTAPNQTLNLTLPQGDPGPEPELYREKTGTTISVTDAGVSLKKLNRVYGDTSQQQYTGKNLFGANASNITLTSRAAEAHTINNDNSFSVSGTGTWIRCTVAITGLEANTQYSMSSDIENTTLKWAGWLCEYNGNNVRDLNNTASFHSNIIFTTDSNGKIELQAFANWSGTSYTVSTTFNNIQLEKGNHQSSFEPYVGGTPAPNPGYPQDVHTVTGTQTITIDNGNGQSSSYNIDLMSKNLFDKTRVTNGYYINASGVLTSSSNFGYSDYIEVAGGEQYTYSGSTQTTPSDPPKAAWYDSNKNWLSKVDFGTSGTITAPANARYFRTSIRTGAGSTAQPFIDTYQFEKGSTATAYTSFWQIELCKIKLSASVTAQDYIYNNNGDWYLHKETDKVVYNSGTGWSRNAQLTTVNRFRLSVGSTYRNGTDPGQMYSNLLTVESTYSGDYEHIYKYGDYLYAFFNNSRAADATALGTYLAANPLICYLALTTPTDTQITDATLIAQLNALNSAATYEGETHITNTANLSNLTGSLDLEYWTWFHFIAETDTIADGAITVPKINSLQDLADALRPYLQ